MARLSICLFAYLVVDLFIESPGTILLGVERKATGQVAVNPGSCWEERDKGKGERYTFLNVGGLRKRGCLSMSGL